jgi:Fe2+ or Zn2+ uptake regulation protein
MELLHQELQGRDEAGELVFTMARSTVYRSLEQLARKSLA